MPEQRHLSILLPVLNEAERLDRSLAQLFSHNWAEINYEVIVCDGGSEDGSLDIAASYPCLIVNSSAGRALQMNAAASKASGDYLLFLHADSRLPDDFDGHIDNDLKWGFFRLRLSAGGPMFRIIEAAINLRTGLSRIAGGDQGLIFKRPFFEELGGYPQIPLMEDIAICKRARGSAKPVIFESAITTSSRRWQERGIMRTILLMWWLRLAYWLGVDPEHLHKMYYPQRG